MAAEVIFAIPGDLGARTGGYIYDGQVVRGLEALGRRVRVLNLDGAFPDPTPEIAAEAIVALASAPESDVLLIDGLAYGVLPTDGVARISAPICALVHHPLALETGLDPTRAERLRALERANLALARHIVVTSPETARTLIADYGASPDDVTVALPGVDRPEAGLVPKASPPRILAVGSLTTRKGHDVLLEALARIRDLHWTAEIVGTDRDTGVKAALFRQCAALGLQDRVTFIGEIEPGELAARYDAASVFALATRYEGYGMVFAEAMAHGLPIVSCAVGAVPTTVPAAAGILTAPDDPVAFAEALGALLTDERRRARFADAATDAAADLPSWSDTAQRIDGVLTDMAAT